jgi:hypothetical protein
MNNFSNDPSCKALWRFESGALTADSISANTLTATASSPAVDTNDYKEGNGSVRFTRTSDQGFYIDDANLSSGFPLKSGDSNKLITACFWYRPTSGDSSLDSKVLLEKWQKADLTYKFCFMVNHHYGYLNYGWGRSDGLADWIQGQIPITDGLWHHIAMIWDGINKTAKFRVWNGTSVTNYTSTFTSQLNISDARLYVGRYIGGNAGCNGRMDELVLFNRSLTDTEVDSIRNGTYSVTATTKVFPAKPSTRILQSQSGRRVFPRAGYVS